MHEGNILDLSFCIVFKGSTLYLIPFESRKMYACFSSYTLFTITGLAD